MRKILFIVFVAAVLFGMSGAEAALRDGTNCAIKPNNLKCIIAEVPDDFGAVGASSVFNIQSDCGEWCDFTSATIFTDPANPVGIPICINTFGKSVNQTKQFKITIASPGKQMEFNYGVCVSDQQDCDTGKGSPCAVVNLNQKYFEIKMDPIIYVQPNQESEFEVWITSATALDIELTVLETGKTVAFTTKPQEKMRFADKIKVSTDTLLNVKAVVKGCQLPGCTKTASMLVTTQKPPPTQASGNFSISLLPESATAKKSQLTKYYLEIKNYGEEKDYIVELTLPTGLKSSFAGVTKKIRNKEDVLIDITPEGTECLYTFTITVRGQATKTVQGSLSVNEASCDLNRLKSTDVLDSQTISNVNSAIVNTRDSTISDDLKSFSDLVGKTGGQATPEPTGTGSGATKPTTKPTPGGFGFDLTTVIIIIVVVVVVLLVVMLKRGKKVERPEQGYWREEV